MKKKRANESLRYIRTSNRKVNQIRHYENERNEHKKLKEQIANSYINNGDYIITEAIFKTGGRADIVILNKFLVIEILNSEKEENVNNKKAKYPDIFEMISYSVKETG